MKKSTQKTIQKIAIGLWIVLIAAALIFSKGINEETIANFSPSNLWLAAIVLLLLSALKTLSLVFYSGAIFAAAGMIFDFPAAIIVGMACAFVMVTEGYYIGKAVGSDFVTEMTEKHPKFAAFTSLKDRNAFEFAFLLRMLKVLNYDLGSMYMGASGMKLVPYLGGSMLAFLPDVVIFTLAGSGIGSFNSAPIFISAGAYVVLTLGSILMLRHMMKKSS